MKKNYIAPSVSEDMTQGTPLLSGSGVENNRGIGYIGMDMDGSKDPADKGESTSIWGEEWD